MTDPYQVLGVPNTATDEQVKEAYRNLARKYHPDNYAGNPLSDLATEKMKEINEAYDEVQRMRRGRSGGGSSSGSAQSYGQGYGQSYGDRQYSSSRVSSQFADIRNMMNSGRVTEAEELLDGVPGDRRDAEWYYLKGQIAYSKGWLDAAMNYLNTACSRDPSNQEYRAALACLSYQRQMGYGQNSGGSMYSSSNCCEICAMAYCFNGLCRCMGSGC